jgi:2-isopropylmalate synthase
MKVRSDAFSIFETGINTKALLPACEMLSSIEGIAPGITKPVAGRNTFSHGSGIHQDGVLKRKQSYEIINPADFGGGETEIILSRHSGKKGVASKVHELLGYYPSGDIMEDVMREYDMTSESLKSVSCTALLEILKKSGLYEGIIYNIFKVSVSPESGGKNPEYRARVSVKVNENKYPAATAVNTDPLKALFTALDCTMPWGVKIKNYSCGFFGAGKRFSATAVIQAVAAGKLVRAESYRHDIYTAMAEAYVDLANYAMAIFKLNIPKTAEFAAHRSL